MIKLIYIGLPIYENGEYSGSTEYEKAIHFLEIGCSCGCSKKIPRERFAKLHEAFQALSKSEQDIFLIAQLKVINGGEITASQHKHLKRKTHTQGNSISRPCMAGHGGPTYRENRLIERTDLSRTT